MADKKEVLLRCSKIVKEFSGNRVLDQVDFDIRKGEVHSLCGENGAGKSTLIKIISGIYPKDDGVIYINGKSVDIHSRQDSTANGIAVVYQELSVMTTLTVAENIMAGKELTKFGFLQKKQMNQKVQELIDKYDLGLKATQRVAELSTAGRQVVEILKALITDASLIIMDEPTASLSYKESEALFKIIRSLRDNGVSILYISHRLDEVYMLSDRINVLRDGKLVGVFDKEEEGGIKPDEVIQAMVGKSLSTERQKELAPGSGKVVLDVKHLSHRGYFNDISLQVHEGEILGIGGLVGAGRTELLRSIFGVDPITAGEVLYLESPLSRSIRQNIKSGIGFISEDRRSEGFIPQLSVEQNAEMINFRAVSRFGVLSRRKERARAKKMIEEVNLHPADPKYKVCNFSGGNQQKIVVGKWLVHNCRLLLIDEPTVGVDVGAKSEIYKMIEDMAANGAAVLLVSSDNEELARVATRILIMRHGNIVGEFNSGMPDRQEITMTASGLNK